MHPIQTAPAFESPLHPPSAFIAFVTSVVTAIPTNQLALQLHPPHPPSRNTPLSPSLSLCSRYTTLAWDGMRKHRPKIPLDPETSSCSWIYHTNKERRGKKMPVTPLPPQQKNTIQKHALLFQNALSHPNWPLLSLSLSFLC